METMEEAVEYLKSLEPEQRPEFVNLTPYKIIVLTKHGELARWDRSESPASVRMELPSKYKLFGGLLGVPVWFPAEQFGFTGLPTSSRTNIIVTPDVGQLMRRLHHPWRGYVLSPDTEFGSARFLGDTWFVERMLYWRLMKDVKPTTD